MKSPYTGKEMSKMYEKRTWKFRGEDYEYFHILWKCEDTGELFTTDETDDAGYNQVTNQYRTKYGLPFTDEIIDIRERYGISATKMAQILGFGVNQWRLYEAGEVPSVSNGRMIRSIMNPLVFLEMVNSSKSILSPAEYRRICSKVEIQIGEIPDGKLDMYDSSRIFASERSAENGYGRQSLRRLKNTLLYIIGNIGEVYSTKMNKILFYSDFLSYRHRGMSITGLSYKALEYGPVPEHWDRVYSQFDEIVQEPRYFGDKGGIVLTSVGSCDDTLFKPQELEVLNIVCDRFRFFSASEISAISHNEKAWLDCHEEHKRIPYDYAFELKAV